MLSLLLPLYTIKTFVLQLLLFFILEFVCRFPRSLWVTILASSQSPFSYRILNSWNVTSDFMKSPKSVADTRHQIVSGSTLSCRKAFTDFSGQHQTSTYFAEVPRKLADFSEHCQTSWDVAGIRGSYTLPEYSEFEMWMILTSLASLQIIVVQSSVSSNSSLEDSPAETFVTRLYSWYNVRQDIIAENI